MRIQNKPVGSKFSDEIFMIRGGSLRSFVERSITKNVKVDLSILSAKRLRIGYNYVYDIVRALERDLDAVT